MRAAVVGGDQQRRLVRLGAGVGEEHPGVRDAGDPGDLLGQLDLLADQVQRRGVHDAGGELPLDRLADLGDVVPDHVGQHAAEEVQVACARARRSPGGRSRRRARSRRRRSRAASRTGSTARCRASRSSVIGVLQRSSAPAPRVRAGTGAAAARGRAGGGSEDLGELVEAVADQADGHPDVVGAERARPRTARRARRRCRGRRARASPTAGPRPSATG